MVTPAYLKGSKPLKVPLQVARELRNILDQLGELQNFLGTPLGADLEAALNAAEKLAVDFVMVEVRKVNFVKDFLLNNQLGTRSTMVASVIGRCPGPDPYVCPHTT